MTLLASAHGWRDRVVIWITFGFKQRYAVFTDVVRDKIIRNLDLGPDDEIRIDITVVKRVERHLKFRR